MKVGTKISIEKWIFSLSMDGLMDDSEFQLEYQGQQVYGTFLKAKRQSTSIPFWVTRHAKAFNERRCVENNRRRSNFLREIVRFVIIFDYIYDQCI